MHACAIQGKSINRVGLEEVEQREGVSDSLDDRQIFWPHPVLYGVTRLVVGFIIFAANSYLFICGAVEVDEFASECLFYHCTVLLLRLIFLIVIFLFLATQVSSRFANFLTSSFCLSIQGRAGKNYQLYDGGRNRKRNAKETVFMEFVR